MSAESILAGLKANTISLPPEVVAELRAQGATPAQMREIWQEYARGFEVGAAEARTAARQRAKAILGHPEAVGRKQMAQHLAFDTDLDADTAIRLLATSPKEADDARKLNRLGAAIAAAGGSPKVGSEFETHESGSAHEVARRIANY